MQAPLQALFVVVVDEKTIIATAGILALDPGTCELRKMYILPSHRGRGVGRLLMEHLLELAQKLGYRKMILETASVLTEAIAMYRRYGFREYHPDHLSARCDQAFFLDLPGGKGAGK